MSVFKFKQFEVDQSGCAMKINTDGVLIGAIASHDKPTNILDIGTGTGVIALMMAQRFPHATVEAVEIDQQASATAGRNFQLSVFSDRLMAYHSSIQNFATSQKYDLIVSNPPFFVNDLKNEEHRKGIARHVDEVFFEALIAKADQLLAPSGKLWLILPVKQAKEVVELSQKHGLNLAEKINLHSDETRPVFRQIICLDRGNEAMQESCFYIYESLKVHTEAYKVLLKDFFLAF